MPEGMRSCPGKDIHAQGLRDHQSLMWTTEDQKIELCCIVHHDFAIAQWSSLMCWIQAALQSCLDCSPMFGACLASYSCSRDITCVWILLILLLISSLHQLINLEPRCNPAAPLLGQNWELPLKRYSLSSLERESDCLNILGSAVLFPVIYQPGKTWTGPRSQQCSVSCSLHMWTLVWVC